MRKFKTIILFLGISLLIPNITKAQDKIKLGVYDLTTLGIDNEKAKILTGILRQRIFSTGKYDLLAEEDMKTILKNLGLKQQLNYQDSEDSIIAELAQSLGIDQMITGAIGKMGNICILDLRLVDAKKAKTINIINKQCLYDDQEIINTATQSILELVGTKTSYLPPQVEPEISWEEMMQKRVIVEKSKEGEVLRNKTVHLTETVKKNLGQKARDFLTLCGRVGPFDKISENSFTVENLTPEIVSFPVLKILDESGKTFKKILLGQVVDSSIDESNYTYFQRTRTSKPKEIYISDIERSREISHFVIIMAVPLFDSDNKKSGLLVAEWKPDELFDIFTSYAEQEGEACMIDFNGIVLMSSKKDNMLSDLHKNSTLSKKRVLMKMENGLSSWDLFQEKKKAYIFAFHPYMEMRWSIGIIKQIE
ncbi:cache domain-containing protein [Candidatus Desantisbacteria bacterium]|nr:cache domain-containing protein [Candidatus Desantisbacteria bacterium]